MSNTPSFEALNYDHPIPKDLTQSFVITCPPSTDLWDKPGVKPKDPTQPTAPPTHSSNAPIIYRRATVSYFRSARVTVSGPWETQYDQGGLALLIIDPSTPRYRWVKTGIEFVHGVANVSTVATDGWSDWSLRPSVTEASATVEMVSEEDGSLWIYLIDGEGGRSPMREVTWWGALDGETEVWVGVYAARPDPEGRGGELEVRFSGLKIEIG